MHKLIKVRHYFLNSLSVKQIGKFNVMEMSGSTLWFQKKIKWNGTNFPLFLLPLLRRFLRSAYYLKVDNLNYNNILRGTH